LRAHRGQYVTIRLYVGGAKKCERSTQSPGIKRMTVSISHINPPTVLSWSTARLWLAVFIVVFSISFSTAHTTLNMLGETGWGDSYHYVNSYYGKEDRGHWRYRILTIELAKLVPAQVEQLLTHATPARRAYIHFAVVNLGFLTLTGLLFFAYCRHLIGNVWLAVLGAVIFLTCRTVQSASSPLVDASAFFFLLLGMWAILRRRPLLLFMTMSIGIFAKETTLLLWPLLWLADHIAIRQKLLLSSLLIPGTFIYLIWRFVVDADPRGPSFFNIEQAGNFTEQLHGMLTPNGFIDIVSSFNLLWIPAVVAALRLSYHPFYVAGYG
jgi:hypothetical protein